MMLSYLLLLFNLYGISVNHDIHVSKCDINYNRSSKIGEVVLTMFLDDVEAQFANTLDLSLFNRDEAVQADSLLAIYISQHLKISHDGQEIPLYYLGKEISEDLSAGYFYLEFDIVQMPKQSRIQADMLMTLFDDQQTILTVRENGKKRFHALQEKEETISVFDW